MGALAGLWTTTLNLDDGLRKVVCNMNARGTLTTDEMGASTSFGRNARWEATAEASSGSISMKLSIGPWMLRGTGVRSNGLRCRSLRGSVLEGGDDPVCVGSFAMTMRMPYADEVELTALERSHEARLDNLPAPPPRFRRGLFIGQWRLLVAFEDDDAPSIFSVRLTEDGKFVSTCDEATTAADAPPGGDAAAPPAGSARLGGSWGVWDASQRAKRQRPDNDTLGTNLFLKVERERCTSTLKGIGNLPVHESFSLWGKPTLGAGLEAQLGARSPRGGLSDLVTGYCYFGTSVDREWFTCGRFSLLREGSAEAAEAEVRERLL